MHDSARVVALGRRLVLLLVCAAVTTLAHATPAARAEGVPRMTNVEFERLEELAEWVYRNGATDVAPDCAAVCTDLWLAEHRPMPNQAASSELWGELTSLEEAGAAEEGVGLLPDIAAAMPFGPYLSAIFLGVGAFEVGWKIGGQIDKWLGIEVPPKPAEGNYYVEWVPAGETWPFFTYVQPMAMPYSGFVVFDEGWGMVAQSEGAAEPCDEPLPTLPGGFTELRWVWNECFMGYSNPIYVPVTAYGLVLKPETTFPNPIEDYDGQQVDAESAPVSDPGTEVVERRLEDALESGRYPVLNQWIDHQLGGRSDNPLCEPVAGARTIRVPAIMPGQTAADYEDCLDTLGLTEHVRVTVPVEQAVLPQPARGVVTVGPDEGTAVRPETQVELRVNPDPLPDPSELDGTEECEISTGEYPVEPPPNDPAPEAFDQITDESLVERPTFLSLRGDTLLRWGAAEAIFDEDEELDYNGWGYQHIKAKHGWEEVDEAATRTALLTSMFPSPEYPDSYVFIGPSYVQGRLTCTREVAVNVGVQGEEPGARGIISSYGRPVDRLPGFMRPAE